jgi:hypothetical protein
MAHGRPLVLIVALYLAVAFNVVNAQKCEFLNGVCRVSSVYIASLKGSSSSVDQ